MPCNKLDYFFCLLLHWVDNYGFCLELEYPTPSMDAAHSLGIFGYSDRNVFLGNNFSELDDEKDER